MTARRRSVHRKQNIPEGNQEQRDLEASRRPSPTGETAKSQGTLPVAVVLEIIAQEYTRGAQEDVLCRVALRLAEESGQLESYRARWEEEGNAPGGLRSSLFFDRNQCLELINYYKSTDRMERLQQEKEKLAQIEGRLLLGGGAPTRITNADLDKLEDFIKESGF